MAGRVGVQKLWGIRPLFLFLCAWGIFVLALGPRFSRYGKHWRWLGLSSLSGILLAVGFPDTLIPLPLLMFAAFVPLLVVEREIAAEREKPSKWEVFKYAYNAFLIWNIISTFWVANTGLAAGIFAIVVNAALMCIPFVLFHQTKKITPRIGYTSLVAYWISFEYGHLNWELTWPWLTLGNSFAEYPALIQWYSLTGVFGGTLWILLMNILTLKIWEGYRSGTSFRKPLVRLALLFIGPVIVSLIVYATYQADGEKIKVLVVQPNYEPHYEKFLIPEEEQVQQFLRLTASKIDQTTDYVVYPETSFGYLRVDQAESYPPLRRILNFLKDYPKAKLVTGLSAYRVFRPDEPLTRAARTRIGPRGDTTYLEVLNAAAQFSPGTDAQPQWYAKSKLVPGAEIFPYRDLFWFAAPLVQSLDGTWEGVATQAERAVFTSPGARIGPAICYESIFGEYYTGYIRRGAEAIFIMTNDGWWDNTAGHQQHLHFASLRAIETRRSIARSANTGISAFIDQRGDIRMATGYDEPAAIQDEIVLNDAITFYVRWGDIIARIALFVAGLMLLNTFVKGVLRRSEK